MALNVDLLGAFERSRGRRDPASADGVPEQGVVTRRRYRCRRWSDTVLIVRPRGRPYKTFLDRATSGDAADDFS